MRVTAAVVLLLLTTSCKDEGLERHQKALEKYSACVERNAPPMDPCFAEVVTILDTIPKDSKAGPKANLLRAALETARQPKLRTPLTIQGGAHLPSEVVTQLQRCHKLAEELGTTAEADRPAKLRELDACRAKAEKLDIDHVHPELHDGGTH